MSFAEYLKTHHVNFDPTTLARQTGMPRHTLAAWLEGDFPDSCLSVKRIAKTMRLSLKERNGLLRAAGFSRCVFADLLAKYKNQCRFSEATLAEKIGEKNKQTINRWINEENSPSSRDKVLKLAEVLGLSITQRSEFLAAAGYEDILSPCVVDRPITHPEQFFGRNYELNRITEQWRRYPLQNIAVLGIKGSGKTSLLYRLCHHDSRLNSAANFNQEILGKRVIIDFKDPRLCQRERLLRHLLISLELPLPEKNLTTFDAIDIIYQHLHHPAFILIDDLEIGLQADELDMTFWGSLRALAQKQEGGRLAFLIAARRLPEVVAREYGKPSPFFNIFAQIMELAPLLESEIDAYFEAVGNQAGLRLSADMRDWLADHSEGWPNRLQFLTDYYLNTLRYPSRFSDGWQSECLTRMKQFCREAEAGASKTP